MSDNAATLDTWSYRPGSWFAVFGPEAAIVLPESQKDQMIGLWALVDGGAGFDEVLDGLLASGLSRIPGFVLVSTGAGTTRILLRGTGVLATVTSAGGDEQLDGAASHTWVERSLDDVTSLSVSLPTEGESTSQDPDFVIRAGLVRVGRIDRPGVVAAAPNEADVAPVNSPVDSDPVENSPVDNAPATAMVVDEPMPDDDPAPLEAHPLDDASSAVTEATVLGEDPATEVMDAVDDTPDTVDDAPDGWITPSDVPPSAPLGANAGVLPSPPTSPPTGPPSTPPADVVPGPPGWVPPPPPAPLAPPVPLDAVDTEVPPPLPVGSWEPLGGLAAPSAPGVDHDGQTIVGGPQPPEPVVVPVPGTPAVPPVTAPVAKLLISDGQTVVVDRAVLIGRSPEARRFVSTEQPTLITVPSRLHEISSTHIEVRPGSGADLGSAVVTDMGSTNGTVLIQPELGPEVLKAGVPVQLIPGAEIDLGDGVKIQVTRP